MESQQQALDSLTDHMALYHRCSSTNQNSQTSITVRRRILQWLSGLSLEERRISVTIVEPLWLSMLLQMQQKLAMEGPGFFFVLPDVPDSSAQKERKRGGNSKLHKRTIPPLPQALPSLCFRRAKGLLTRLENLNSANGRLCRNLQLFSSHDGELVASKLHDLHPLDSLSVTEMLLGNVDEFVAVMDEISTGRFLHSPPSAASPWEELPWLKAMGYYSLAAFVANKLELAIWSSWFHSDGLKYRAKICAGSVSRELQVTGRTTRAWSNDKQHYSLRSRICQKHRAFLDWCSKEKLDVNSRAVKYALLKAAKLEVVAMTRCDKVWHAGSEPSCKLNIPLFSNTSRLYYSDSDTEKQASRVYSVNPFSLLPFFLRLKALKGVSISLLQYAFLESKRVLQRNDHNWLFYTSLNSANTLTDRITRRVRNVLMKVMKDSVELELFGNRARLDQLPCKHLKDMDAKNKKEKKRRKNRQLTQSKMLSEQESANASVTSEILQEQPGSISYKELNAEKKSQSDLAIPADEQNILILGKGKKKKRGRCKAKITKDNCSSAVPSDEKLKGKNLLEQGAQTLTSKFIYNISDCVDLKSSTSCTSTNCHEPCSFKPEEMSYSQSSNSYTMSASISSSIEKIERDKNGLLDTLRADSSGDLCISKGDRGVPASTGCSNLGSAVLRNTFNTKAQETQRNSIRISDKTCTLNTSPTAFPVQSLSTTNCSIVFQGVGSNIYNATKTPHRHQHSAIEIENMNLAKLRSLDLSMGLAVSSSLRGNSAAAPCGLSCSSPKVGSDYLTYLKRRSGDTLPSKTNGLVTSHEWLGLIQVHSPVVKSHILPAATERLHLDVDKNWQKHPQTSLVTLRTSGTRPLSGPTPLKRNNISKFNTKSLDWPTSFHSGYNIGQRRGYCSYSEEAAVIPFTQAPYISGFSGTEFNRSARAQDDMKNGDKTPEDTDYDDSNYFSGDFEDYDALFKSEEEGERHFADLGQNLDSDYNRIFGGGVMYWNTPDYAGTGYSRPPSLSSEDSSWARHEAEISVVLDDVMKFSSMSGSFAGGSTPNVLSTSPPIVSCHPGYDHAIASPNLCISMPRSENEFSGTFSAAGPMVNIEDKVNDGVDVVTKLTALEEIGTDIGPDLRPITVRDHSLKMQLSLSDSSRHQEARSPHVGHGRRELPRWKRPPSPVLRCVPPAPPPSPVGGFRKRRSFTTARSGSSSPRHWGLANWTNKEEMDGKDLHMQAGCPDVNGTAWRSRNIKNAQPVHPISGTLLRERLIALPSLALEQEHPDVALPMQTSLLLSSNPALETLITKLQNILHEEIEEFCKQVATENLLRKPFINAAIKKVSHVTQVLWPRSRLKIFGSNATGLALPSSDVDLVVCLPPVRNLEPIKEAGILEGRNGIKETCLQQAARYLADQDWVKADSLKTIENTAIPIIMLVAHIPTQPDNYNDAEFLSYTKEHMTEVSYNRTETDQVIGNNFKQDGVQDLPTHSNMLDETRGPWGSKLDRGLVRLDISFETSSHTGIKTAELVRELIGQFPALFPLALVMRQFLMDRSLDHPYTGGLSSYCLVLLVVRFLQHQSHLGWPFQQNLGRLLMDFLHFFGCVFDPRQMGIRIRGGGLYVKRDRGHIIDPLHIEDPLHPLNNVGRNCFRILQCSKAFSDAYYSLEKEIGEVSESMHFANKGNNFIILQKILPSIMGF